MGFFLRNKTPDFIPLRETNETISSRAIENKKRIAEANAVISTKQEELTVQLRDAEMLARIIQQPEEVALEVANIMNGTSISEDIEEGKQRVSIDKKTLIIVPQELVTKYPFASICQGKQEILLERLRRLDFSDRKRALLEFPEGKISIKNGDTIHEITLDQRVSIGDIETSLNLYIPGSPLFH